MDTETLTQYIGKEIKLTISSGYYYRGVVLNVTEKSLTMSDIRGNNLSLSPENIILIEVVGK